MGNKFLLQFLFQVGGAHHVQVGIEDLVGGVDQAAAHLHVGIRVPDEFRYQLPDKIHGAVDEVGIESDADMGKADFFQLPQVVIVVFSGKEIGEPGLVGFLQPLQNDVVLEECGGFGDAEQVIVQLIGQLDFIGFRLGEKRGQQFGVFVAEKVMPFQIIDGNHGRLLTEKVRQVYGQTAPIAIIPPAMVQRYLT